ncbi:Uncharacterised protein [Mycobacteroides abscessus subsp. abscessus]|uniref:hypothetical protein n=1 Tax=Mycobacteroides abscessus TaxID=36809 RepID=UPI0009A61C28|nr:hypothetical protein [Mycobacteroides abscessus]SKF72837.1 Uncharacterised protein [Mycobacteroides abscessus subsp. abscessus]
MGKFIVAGLLGFLGLGLIGDYPVWGFGMLAAAAVLGWMSLQGRQSARVERSRPVAARQARQEVQSEVNSAQREANRQVRQSVERARREARRNLSGAVQRVEQEQRERWVA